MLNRTKKDRGFTLVEMMIVVALVGIAAVILAVAFLVHSGAGEWLNKVGAKVTSSCTPGQTVTCPMHGGTMSGGQTCLPDGNAFGPCQ